MKSFKEYLTESKKVFEFKVKVAGSCPKDCAKLIKGALSEFKVENCSAGKSTPIQETQVDFPSHKNIGVTVFDVSVSYPATSVQLRSLIAEATGLSADCIKVRTIGEEAEVELNHAHDNLSGEALLGKDYESSNNQDLVGEKHTMSLLRDLNKVKHNGTQVTGTNDSLLASKLPSEKAATVNDKVGTASVLNKLSNPDPRKGK